MMWSKLKKRFKEFITPELRDRIDVYCTSYHDAHDDYGEAWITLDGEKVFGGGYYHWYTNPIPHPNAEFSVVHGFHEDYYRPHIESKDVQDIMESGIQETSHVTRNIGNYLNRPFEDALTSNNPIYRAFALIDRRLGKRRFDAIQVAEVEHPLVVILYELRKACFENKG